MKQRFKLYSVLICLVLVLTNCEGVLFSEDPANDPVSNFDLLWDDFDKTYSFFVIKDINWDSVYQVYRPMVNAQTSNAELFKHMSNMLATLKDGHVNLYGNSQMIFKYNFLEGKPKNFLGLSSTINQYIDNYQDNGTVGFGSINAEIGYITIPTFGDVTEKYFYIDTAIKTLRNKKKLIIDIRNNGGGSDINAEIISSRFSVNKRLYRYVKYKNGPKHNDFTELIPDYIDKGGSEQFTGKVIVLTNRECFSSTESFILQMKTIPNVTTLGDTTGGGSGNPIGRELPNGWSYRIPRWIMYKPDTTIFEGKGLAPDLAIWISEQDLHNNVDTILEKAVELLQ